MSSPRDVTSVGSTESALRISPAARILWRAADVVQLELGERRIIVDGVAPHTVQTLAPADHRRRPIDAGGSPTSPGRESHPDGGTAELLDLLHRAGFLSRLDAEDGRPPGASSRLDPDLRAPSARFGDRAGAVLRSRARRQVAVHGHGRLPVALASLLAAAGIGRLEVGEATEVRLADATPGGLLPADEGRRHIAAAGDAGRRAAPEVSTRPPEPERPPDLVVLAGGLPVDAPAAQALQEAGLAHLVAGVWADTAVVGPLVLPGRTSCLRCADLHRIDRDPGWAALSVQLALARPRTAPSDVTVYALAAAVAAVQCLAHLDDTYLDGAHPGGDVGPHGDSDAPAAVNGTLEIALPDWRIRRRSWPAHPSCGCCGPA